MNWATVIVAGLVAGVFLAIVISSIRGKKLGKGACSSCGGSCGSCGMQCHSGRN